ncbi:MAG: hypothetical protein V4655_07580 [Bdellovibrionota bacterium]
MATLGEEIEEASRGRKVPLDLPDRDKDDLQKSKVSEVEKRFDRVNADRNEDKEETLDDVSQRVQSEDYAKGSAKETLSDKITPHHS